MLSQNFTIVAAVGNLGADHPPQYPAAYDGVIGVTAVDFSGDIYEHANQGESVDFAALGVDIAYSSDERGASVSGTSYAAPVVSAYIASTLLLDDNIQSDTALFAALVEEAIDLGPPGHDNVFGYGALRLPPVESKY